jgi:hypothetical protein
MQKGMEDLKPRRLPSMRRHQITKEKRHENIRVSAMNKLLTKFKFCTWLVIFSF